ncbi:MAG: hypothetical protein J0665_16930, partial [Deltaproteobacteria bacterium]|nr:hypothetical protein [Deltaproteobacteria bacterium]
FPSPLSTCTLTRVKTIKQIADFNNFSQLVLATLHTRKMTARQTRFQNHSRHAFAPKGFSTDIQQATADFVNALPLLFSAPLQSY